MNPLLDHILTGAMIMGALAFLAKRIFLRRSGKSCEAGCGCSAAKPKIKRS